VKLANGNAPNRNILVSAGKENNSYSLISGERTGNRPNRTYPVMGKGCGVRARSNAYLKSRTILECLGTEGDTPVDAAQDVTRAESQSRAAWFGRLNAADTNREA
jgi:hypothetical protein